MTTTPPTFPLASATGRTTPPPPAFRVQLFRRLEEETEIVAMQDDLAVTHGDIMRLVTAVNETVGSASHMLFDAGGVIPAPPYHCSSL